MSTRILCVKGMLIVKQNPSVTGEDEEKENLEANTEETTETKTEEGTETKEDKNEDDEEEETEETEREEMVWFLCFLEYKALEWVK